MNRIFVIELQQQLKSRIRSDELVCQPQILGMLSVTEIPALGLQTSFELDRKSVV